MFNIHIGVDQPAEYEIKIQGRLAGKDSGLADWFQSEARICYEPGVNGETITALRGVIADQAALHGLLNQIRDWGVTLLYVDCVSGRK